MPQLYARKIVSRQLSESDGRKIATTQLQLHAGKIVSSEMSKLDAGKIATSWSSRQDDEHPAMSANEHTAWTKRQQQEWGIEKGMLKRRKSMATTLGSGLLACDGARD